MSGTLKKKTSIFVLCALLLALCVSAEAQQSTKIPRIGYLQARPAAVVAGRTDAFRQGLRDLGYIERMNIVVEWRYTGCEPNGPENPAKRAFDRVIK